MDLINRIISFPHLYKLISGGIIILTSTTTTSSIANKHNSPDEKYDSKAKKWGAKFVQDFPIKLILKNPSSKKLLFDTEKKEFSDLDEEEIKSWNERLMNTYQNKHHIKSKRFWILIKENTPDYGDGESSKLQKLLKGKNSLVSSLYNECKFVSNLLWRRGWRNQLNAALEIKSTDPKREEKYARYLKDAWASCSVSGSSNELPNDWPLNSLIKSKVDSWKSPE